MTNDKPRLSRRGLTDFVDGLEDNDSPSIPSPAISDKSPQPDLFGRARSIVNKSITGRACNVLARGRRCGSETFIMSASVGIHGPKLTCTLCGGVSWLSKDRAIAMPMVMEGTSV